MKTKWEDHAFETGTGSSAGLLERAREVSFEPRPEVAADYQEALHGRDQHGRPVTQNCLQQLAAPEPSPPRPSKPIGKGRRPRRPLLPG